MKEKKVWIVGHKHPDTDSICAAVAYAYLKNEVEKDNPLSKEGKTVYVPRRAGEISAETSFVLDYFKVEAPELIQDVGTQLSRQHRQHIHKRQLLSLPAQAPRR